jgi:hypothetical protein
MKNSISANREDDPLYSKCEAIVEKNIEPIFDEKEQFSSEKIENYEVLFCLIYNIVAHVIHIMPLHEIKDAVKTGTGLAIDGYLDKFNEETLSNFDDEDHKDKIIN